MWRSTASRSRPQSTCRTGRGFYRFCGKADDHSNIDAYWRHLSPRLDAGSRDYWESRGAFGLGARRISMFEDNLYRHGLLGRFIGLGHAVARLYGCRPARHPARSLPRRTTPVLHQFHRAFVRQAFHPLGRRQSDGAVRLGIPPAQYQALATAGDSMAAVLRHRVERLTCDFSIDDNYFAWQAFGRAYGEAGPCPPYLARQNHDAVRAHADRVTVLNRSFTEHLQGCPDASVDRYVSCSMLRTG